MLFSCIIFACLLFWHFIIHKFKKKASYEMLTNTSIYLYDYIEHYSLYEFFTFWDEKIDCTHPTPEKWILCVTGFKVHFKGYFINIWSPNSWQFTLAACPPST